MEISNASTLAVVRTLLKVVYLVVLILFFFISVHAQPTHSFEIKEGNFLLEGKAIQVHSGEMHYARIPKAYWRHRIKMIKAMGLNTIATYVFWNYHNTAPGTWDFTSGNRNLKEFLTIAKEEGLFVILRPGPYACAEWEFGGYPWWLQKNKDLVIRTNNKPFLDSCKVYITKLAQQVKDFQVTKGGPIILVQAENEFGSYVSQRKDISREEHALYNQTIKNFLSAAGFEVPFFTSDGTWLFDGGSLPGVLPTANGEGNIDNLKKAVNQYHENIGPYMVAEFYPGWLDHWDEPFTRIDAEQVVKQTEKYLQNKVHFNMYMAHGGTNFGFTAGANYNEEHDIQPDITSYDYDAPISEPGWATPKYLALRDLMKKYVTYPVPEIPSKNPVSVVPGITVKPSVDLFEWKKNIKPVVNDVPLTFEELEQGSGYVLYSRRFAQPVQGTLSIKGLRDYGLVYINGKKIGELNRVDKKYELEVSIPFNGKLEIVVENMGRINYGADIVNNSKGIIAPVLINNFEITGDWQMYKIPMDKLPTVPGKSSTFKKGLPTLYTGTFTIKNVGDTFIDTRAWGKGIVFVNGYNLGRYWKVGPQQTLYVPGCWLTKGVNNIMIFEQQNDVLIDSVKTLDHPLLDAVDR